MHNTNNKYIEIIATYGNKQNPVYYEQFFKDFKISNRLEIRNMSLHNDYIIRNAREYYANYTDENDYSCGFSFVFFLDDIPYGVHCNAFDLIEREGKWPDDVRLKKDKFLKAYRTYIFEKLKEIDKEQNTDWAKQYIEDLCEYLQKTLDQEDRKIRQQIEELTEKANTLSARTRLQQRYCKKLLDNNSTTARKPRS